MASRFTEAYIKKLAYKWERGLLTASEKADFEAWYNSHNDEQVEMPSNYDDEETIRNRLLDRLVSQMNAEQTAMTKIRRKPAIFWLAAASVLFLMLSIGAYIVIKESSDRKKELLTKNNDINPGTNKAILTLANGRKINLDSATDGALAEESGIKISKKANGQVVYEVISGDDVKSSVDKGKKEARYNTIETPKGGQYKIVLPDRSQVWLNAASSLKYPTNFTDENRIVELKGEAYFEIAADEQRPFLVKSKHQLVHVLGTQFNILAYDEEEAVKTTLVEGAVRIEPASWHEDKTHDQVILLRSGEQSTVIKGKTSVAKVAIEPYVSWREGVFYFDETKLTDAMQQLSRWYDVDVVYQGEVPNTYFYGEISRTKTLSAVLAILQEGGVKFKIDKKEGSNTLIVY